MSQPAVAALAPLPFELVEDDGVPLETDWHHDQITLLKESIKQLMKERGRNDYFVGGNMFVYYSLEQARQVAEDFGAGIVDQRRCYRGPDVFYVGGVEGQRKRRTWTVWDEGHRYPEVIVELLSVSTATIDRTVKKELYAGTFRTPEYFYYDPDKLKLEGFRLAGKSYRPIVPNAQGRLWSERLGVELGLWQGVYQEKTDTWIRLFHPDGRLALIRAETAEAQAEAEHQRAEAEHQRAEAAEAELARLRARLGEG